MYACVIESKERGVVSGFIYGIDHAVRRAKWLAKTRDESLTVHAVKYRELNDGEYHPFGHDMSWVRRNVAKVVEVPRLTPGERDKWLESFKDSLRKG